MLYVLNSLFWFLLLTGILVAWHEFGHFWVGRKLGVKTVRFAVGFGRSIYSRQGKDGTDYAIKMIPLGGYVKFVDTREGDVAEADMPFAFDQQPIWKRALIVLAGPLANLLLAIFVFILMFMLGKQDYRLVLANAEGPAQAAGLQRYDEIIQVGDVKTPSIDLAVLELVHQGYQKAQTPLRVRDVRSGVERSVQLDLRNLPTRFDEKDPLLAMGMLPYHRDADTRVDGLDPKLPAAQAGVLPGDEIIAINGSAVGQMRAFVKLLNEQAPKKDGWVELTLRRNGQTQMLSVRAVEVLLQDKTTIWRLGISFQAYQLTQRLSLSAASLEAVRFCKHLFDRSISTIGALLGGQASLKNVSGPVTIAQVAEATARSGLAKFLEFMGLISLSLFIVNLLPIPMLDGGQLMYFAAEWLKGGALSQNAQFVGQIIGVLAILGLMLLAFYNDLARVFGAA
jgi:regulator of sigma E protease